jgi:hypothetical protein
LKRKYFFAVPGKKDWSGKPGFRRSRKCARILKKHPRRSLPPRQAHLRQVLSPWYGEFMSLFCLLWLPLFYLFRHSLSRGNPGSGGIWALLLGGIVALAQFFLGNLVNPGGFGFSRWVSACIDIVALPAALPFLVYLAFIAFRLLSGPFDFANFALLWLIPGAAIRAVSWSAARDPTLLVLAPLLWTAIALGIPFFIDLMLRSTRWYALVSLGLGMLALPLLAAAVWWAFYSQKFSLGTLLLVLTVIPMLVSLVRSFIRE